VTSGSEKPESAASARSSERFDIRSGFGPDG
jgi:hypothetical protein